MGAWNRLKRRSSNDDNSGSGSSGSRTRPILLGRESIKRYLWLGQYGPPRSWQGCSLCERFTQHPIQLVLDQTQIHILEIVPPYLAFTGPSPDRVPFSLRS